MPAKQKCTCPNTGCPAYGDCKACTEFHKGKPYCKSEETREARKKILKEQREALAARIEELQQTLEKLDWKVANYDTFVFEAEKKLNPRPDL